MVNKIYKIKNLKKYVIKIKKRRKLNRINSI